jgi:isocitrate dehydrogenase (NAD+)
MRIIFIQGGGLGVDQEAAVRRILAATGLAFEWEVFEAGLAAIDRGREPLPMEMLAAIRETGVALKTKLLQPAKGKHPNYNVQLRRELGQFASVRPLRNVQGLPARFQGVNILLVREITEDLYRSIEHEIVPGVVQSIKVVTETACRRFFKFAFDLARGKGRKLIHCVHKANILKMADGLFLECFREVARSYPEIEAKEIIVDNCCMQLVTRPQQFDVMATGNLYGDLLSDLGAGLIGGISGTSGINCGEGVRVYEAIHGGPTEAMGANRANLLPLLYPACDMLEDLGHAAIAQRVRKAVETVLTTTPLRSMDLGGKATTSEMADSIIRAL